MKYRIQVQRLPIRGKAWIIALYPVKAMLLILRPKLTIRFYGMDDHIDLDLSEWMRLRLK